MDHSICSLNVRGPGQKTKRKQIFNFLEKKQFKICLLQKTHSKPALKSLWKRECKHHIFISGRSSNRVCILVEKSLQFKLIYHKEIIPGKIQVLKLNIDDHDIVLINVNGPNNDDASFFETLYDFLGENDEKEYIIGGEFNTDLNSNLDKFGGIKGTHQKCRDKIIASIDNFDLADI